MYIYACIYVYTCVHVYIINCFYDTLLIGVKNEKIRVQTESVRNLDKIV